MHKTDFCLRRRLKRWVGRKVLLPFGGLCRQIRRQWLTCPNSGVGALASFIQALMCVLNNFLSCYLFSLPLPHLYSNQPTFLSTILFFCGLKALSITLSALVIILYFLCMEKTYHPFLFLTFCFSAATRQALLCPTHPTLENLYFSFRAPSWGHGLLSCNAMSYIPCSSCLSSLL